MEQIVCCLVRNWMSLRLPPHHNRFTVLFRDHPGEPVTEQNFWRLWCKKTLTKANTPTIRLGATPSGLTSAHLHHAPIFTGWMPFLPPNQQRKSIEGNYRISLRLIMAALRNRCGHYIFALWFLLLLLPSFFLAWFQPSQVGCLPYLHTWCGLSANLRCRSETWCTGLAANTGRKKSSKNRNLGTTAQFVGPYLRN